MSSTCGIRLTGSLSKCVKGLEPGAGVEPATY
jgi:hypothetical protein